MAKTEAGSTLSWVQQASELAQQIRGAGQLTRERALACTKLEEAAQWLEKDVARNGATKRDGGENAS
jgi:hypothetical protein